VVISNDNNNDDINEIIIIENDIININDMIM